MAKVTVKVAKSGDPKVPGTKDFDVRDKLADLVIRGNSIVPDEKKAIYSSLITALGEDKARKIMDHAYIFNTRPEVQGLPLEQRLNSFYTIGSNDPDVMDVLTRSKSLGYGILPGMRNSSSSLQQEATGRVRPVDVISDNPELRRKVMIQVRK